MTFGFSVLREVVVHCSFLEMSISYLVVETGKFIMSASISRAQNFNIFDELMRPVSIPCTCVRDGVSSRSSKTRYLSPQSFY